MATTAHRNWPLPDPANTVREEFEQFRDVSLPAIDQDMHETRTLAEGKAEQNHSHQIIDVEGLEAALAGKMPANTTFGLGDLTDVEGFAEAADGYLPVKLGAKVIFQSAAAAIGNHQHQVSDIVGLETALQNAVPAGMGGKYFGTTPPAGWLKANGAAVSRTTYAALFAAIGTSFGVGDGSTTFNLPDARGEFLRGFDDGRGVDSGRVWGSAQGDQNKAHTHTGTATSGGSHNHSASSNTTGGHNHAVYGGYSNNAGGAYFYVSSGSTSADRSTTSSWAGDHSHTITVNSGGAHTHTLSIDSSGGSEARPRNIAPLICIKY